MTDLERGLVALGRELDVPEAPDVVTVVLARLEPERAAAGQHNAIDRVDQLVGTEQIRFDSPRRAAADVHGADRGRIGQHDGAAGRPLLQRVMTDLDARYRGQRRVSSLRVQRHLHRSREPDRGEEPCGQPSHPARHGVDFVIVDP